MGFTIQEIVEATGGELVQGFLRARVKGVSTDTRRVRQGDLFIAVKGDNFDGHNFLPQAVKGGAIALVISHGAAKIPKEVAVIQVEDTIKAYGLIARYHRRRFKVPVIAITGSAGKTTTKELIVSVLKTKYRVLCNKGTENNHIGVPSTLLKLRAGHDIAVIETGTNHPGEISWLGTIVEPTVAVFTNVGASHLEGLGSPEGVFREKSALIERLSKQGVVIVNADDQLLANLIKRKISRKVLSYGVDQKADVHASKIKADANGVSFVVGGGIFELKTPDWGNIYNALAAISCGRLLKVSAAEIRRGLLKFKPPRGRQVFHRIKGIIVIDDTYNANPLSFKNALRTLMTIKGKGRAVLVSADMLELGQASEKLHREVGAVAANQGLDVLLSFGQRALFIGEEARLKRPSMDIRHFTAQEKIIDALKAMASPGDVILVKGSRGMQMEHVVQGLIAYLKG